MSYQKQFFYKKRWCNLKTILCLFLYTALFSNLYAQTTYKITYSVPEIKIEGPIDKVNGPNKQIFKQVLAYSKNLNYILIANQKESFFEEVDILSKGDTPLENIYSQLAQRFTSFHESIYSNYDVDSLIVVKNLVDKDFMVKRGFYNFDWILKNESKIILGYEARKAEGKYYDPVTKKDLNVEAWFIPLIPLQSGPDIFMGLPGLIAEVNLKGAVVTVKAIEIDEKFIIEKIDESKAMTEQEYLDLIDSLNKKFIDN